MSEKAIRVLLIEDNPGDARLAREMLAGAAKAPFELEAFDRLDAGLKRLAGAGADVVLLDLSLPDSQGLDTLIKARAQAPATPIVALTGQADEELGMKAVHEGAQDFLAKSVLTGQLLWRVIGYAIERKRGEQALALALDESRRRGTEISALLDASKAILKEREFAEAARAIFDSCKNLIGAVSGFVALLSDDGAANEVLFVDSGGVCMMRPDLSAPVRGLTRGVFRDGAVIWENDFAASQWAAFAPQGHPKIENLLLAPLMIEETTIGVLGLTNKPGGFTEADARMAAAFGELASVALRNAQAVRSLEASERFLKDIFDSIQDGISVLDTDLNIVRANVWMEALYGDGKPLAGRKCYEVYQQRDTLCPWCPTIKAIESGESRHGIVPHPSGDKPTRWMDLSAFPLKNAQGKVVGVIEYVKDVTEQKRAEAERQRLEAQIQQAQKLESLGVLAGGIAHDFNNLLMGVLGNADLALMDLSPVSPARQSIKEIEMAARRAADLCRQMLAYSGKGRFVIESINLNELVEEMAHLLEVSISKKAVLKYNFADNLPSIEADATQIRQVIMNLITNASEAIGDKSGVISVSTGAMDCDHAYLESTWLKEQHPEGVYVYIEVADTGCGMDGETQARLFDPFFTTKFTGRGLGLAAVLGIVRGHKGAIKVYSEPARGTTFKVLFPAADQNATPPEKEAGAAKPWRGSGKILLVDDEETVRAVGRRMLERGGFKVLTAADGREAVELFGKHAPEIACVLLDLTMPHMDGEETFRELRRIRGDVRVVISSGYNEQEVMNRFSGKGLAGFIQKPYQTSVILNKMRDVLGQDRDASVF